MYYIFIFSRDTDKEWSQICQWPQSHSRRRAVGRRQRQPAYRQKLTNFSPGFDINTTIINNSRKSLTRPLSASFRHFYAACLADYSLFLVSVGRVENWTGQVAFNLVIAFVFDRICQ